MASPAVPSFVALTELPADFVPNNYRKAVAVEATDDPTILKAELKRDWCIGQGISPKPTSCLLHLVSLQTQATATIQTPTNKLQSPKGATAANHYLSTTHASLNQPDLITLHTEFLSRTVIGPCTLSITTLKLGRQFSTLRISLSQPTGPKGTQALCLEATVTQGNLAKEASNGGLTLPTRPAVPKEQIPRIAECVIHEDAPEFQGRRPALAKLIFKLARDANERGARPAFGPSVREQWVRWRDPTEAAGGFDVSSLCFLADTFWPLGEAYGEKGNWFPTMNCSLEVKRAPPRGRGWEWLFVRLEMKECRNGRNDLDMVILDQSGDVVALSKHTALIVSAERNYKVKGVKI